MTLRTDGFYKAKLVVRNHIRISDAYGVNKWLMIDKLLDIVSNNLLLILLNKLLI